MEDRPRYPLGSRPTSRFCPQCGEWYVPGSMLACEDCVSTALELADMFIRGTLSEPAVMDYQVGGAS